MKSKILSAFLLVIVSAMICYAQTNQNPVFSQSSGDNSLTKISTDLTKISKSVADLNKSLKTFFETFSSNQGLRLTERQSKMLLVFEVLNRAEQRLATFTKLRIELTEKQSDTRIKLARVEDEMRDENIERGVAIRGTTNANEVREARRSALNAERVALRNLLLEIQKTLAETNEEIPQTEFLIQGIRPKLFAEIQKELIEF